MSDPTPTPHPHWTWIVALLLGLTPTPGLGQCTYTVQIIEAPTCPGDYPSPTRGEGLNDSGHVVGYYSPCITGNHKAYVWTGGPGITTLVPPPGVSESQAFDIANTAENGPLGRIVGQLDGTNYPIRAFEYDNGQWTIIQPPRGGLYTSASATNDNHAAVGYQSNGKTGSLEAVMWLNGSTVVLQVPYGTNAVARDVNRLNQVVGKMETTTVNDIRGFLWTEGKAIDLGLLENSTVTDPMAINRHRQIVGRALVPGFNPEGTGLVAHAFHWQEGVLTDLGTLPGMIHSFGFDVSENGDVVGSCRSTRTSLNTQRAFIWRDGQMTNLNDLIPPDSNCKIDRANAINDAGQIACTGLSFANLSVVAVLLTPVPEQPGDTDCDGNVNVDDLWNVIRRWGECDPYPAHCPADFNADDIVNVPDLITVLMNWG